MERKTRVLDNLLISLLSLLMVAVFILFPLSFSLLNTSQSVKEQYSLLDTYYTVNNMSYDRNSLIKTSSDITIVDLTDVTERPEVYAVLKKIITAEPKLIGFDVWMAHTDSVPTPVEDSLRLLLSGNPKIVSPCVLSGESSRNNTSFLYVDFPFYASEEASNIAAANIDLMGTNWNCRTFTPVLSCQEREYESFAVALSSQLSPNSYHKVMMQPSRPHYINYSRMGYQNLSGSFLLTDTTGISEMLIKDKVVLVGDTNDISDLYPTPIKIRMSGVEIHANILNTILTESWPRIMSDFLAWIVAFLGVFCLIPFIRSLQKNDWLRIFSGAIRALLILLLVFLSYLVFVKCHYYIKIIYLVLGIGFMEIAESLYKKLTNKRK